MTERNHQTMFLYAKEMAQYKSLKKERKINKFKEMFKCRQKKKLDNF